MKSRTVWTLLLALLLQLLLGSAWAMRSAHPVSQAGHCHEVVALPSPAPDAHHGHAAKDKAPTFLQQADGHHCCAVGLGQGVQPWLQPLPSSAPASQHGTWISQSPRPDLRPPI